MSGQSSSEIIRRWSSIGRWRREEEDILEWDSERQDFILAGKMCNLRPEKMKFTEHLNDDEHFWWVPSETR
jgi:hypothetical protein